MLEKSHSPSVQPHLKKKFPIVSMSIAAILSLTACEQNPTTWCPPQWVPVSASIGLDGAPWRDVECQQSGAILWEFMNEPRKLGYLGADVAGTIQSIQRLYQIVDAIDNQQQNLHDIQEALNIVKTLLINNIKEDSLNAQREQVYEYGKKLKLLETWLQKHREMYFQGSQK